MVDPRLYETETFVLLESGQPEQILSAEELSDRLQAVLQTCQDCLPRDVRAIDTLAQQSQYLMDTVCELDLGPEKYFQWFAIRVEK